VQATVDGILQSGSTAVSVHASGVPSAPEVLPVLAIIDDMDARFLSNRIVLISAEDADPADVDAAVGLIDGEIVGYAGPGVWQVAIEPVSTLAELEDVLAAVSVDPVVLGAAPDYVGNTTGAVVPDDPIVGDYLREDSLLPSISDAWAFGTGNERPVIVALLDSGINSDHPELVNKIVPGRDFSGAGLEDDCFHGTRMAGIIGAETNNGAGIAGVNWGARILPVRVTETGTEDVCGSFRNSVLASAIDYSVVQGASVLNMSLGSNIRSEDIVKALSRATAANRFSVAAAGNDGERKRLYPAGYKATESFSSWFGTNERSYSLNVIAVGANNTVNIRADFSNRGPWVNVWAPGQDILTTCSDITTTESEYCFTTGTSPAAAVVSGIVSLMVSQQPDLSITEGYLRVLATNLNRADSDEQREEFGPAGFFDPYQMIVNDSFEFTTSPWSTTGTASTVFGLGPINPRLGATMLSLSSGPGAANDQSTARRVVNVPAGELDDGELTISVWYNFVSEEFPEFVNGGFNDFFTVDIRLPNGSSVRVVDESVDATQWTPVSGIDLPGGDSTVGQSGWRLGSVTLPAASLDGAGAIEILVADRGDSVYDSIGLVDGINVS